MPELTLPIATPVQPLGLTGETLQPVPAIVEPKEINPQAREILDAQRTVNVPGFREVLPNLVDAGGAKKIDLNARESLGGFTPVPGFREEPAPRPPAGFRVEDDLDLKSVEDLDKDRKNFRPAEYFAANPNVANDPKRLAKLLEVYRRRDEEGLTFKGTVEAAVEHGPGVVKDVGGGVLRLGERAIDLTLQPIANVVLGTLTGDLFDDQKRAALFNETRRTVKKGVAEVTAGAESAAVGLTDLARTGTRRLKEAVVEKADGKPKTDQELLAQISADASFKQAAELASKGEGEFAKNLGIDRETLAKQGVELDMDAIRQLSLVDPITMVATGGAFKLVGIGGKVLGTAKTIAGAEYAANKLADLAKYSAGKTIQGIGKAAEVTGTVAKGTGTGAATIAGVATAATGGGITPALIVGGATKLAGPALRSGGKVMQHAGKAIAGEVPVSANLQKVLDVVSIPATAGKEISKGALQGLTAAAPFALAAADDETAGTLFGAGAGLGGIAAGGAKALRVVKTAPARRYFGENRSTAPDVASPGYGIDTALDGQHEVNLQKLPAADIAEINNFREGLRNHGGELYVLDRATWRQKMKDSHPGITDELLNVYENHSAFFDVALGPDRKVVYLNGDATGLRHDAGHIFDAILSPEKRAELEKAVVDTFGQEAIDNFGAYYERQVGNKIGPKDVLREFIAEQFNALFHNVPLDQMNAPRSLLNKFVDTVSEAAENLGIDLTDGATTPALGAPVAIGIRQMFRNAAGDVLKSKLASETSPTAPSPATPTNITPLPVGTTAAPARNIRVTPENVVAFKQSASPEVRAAADARARETGVEYARSAAKNESGPTAAVIDRISTSMESGSPVVQIEHLGITSASTPEAPLGRTPRRGEHASGYAALEAAQLATRQGAPPEIVSLHSKNFVPVRWTDQGGTPTLIAMSLDKVIANVLKIAADPKAKDLIPYAVENGKLTPDGWREVVADAQKYSENQANGLKGDGGRLEVPEAGLSIPAENPAYTPQPLSPERANFQNLVQGIAPPLTSRSQKGATPGNVKGQILAEANLRPTEAPANISPSRINRQEFAEFPGRTVQEVNPLRNEMVRRGVDVRQLIEVTERIRAKDIVSAEPRPDVNYRAPVTDVIRGGFQPAPTEFRQKNLGGRTVEEFSDYILKSSATEWKAATDNMSGGLTGGAWNLGLGLKNAADVGVLKSYASKLSDAAREAMKSGDFDNAYSLVAKGQFFREAFEAATGTGSAGAAFKRGTAGMEAAKPPFPEGAGFLPEPLPETTKKMENASPLVKNEDGSPRVFFHGSYKSAELVESGKWDLSKTYQRGLYGPGFYFTSSADAAGGPYWKNQLRKLVGMEPLGYALKPTAHDPFLSAMFAKERAQNPSPGVVASFLDLKNPFDARKFYSPTEIEAILRNTPPVDPRWLKSFRNLLTNLLHNKGGTDGQAIYEALNEYARYVTPPEGARTSRAGQPSFTQPLVNEWLQKSGFDGVVYPGGLKRGGIGLHDVAVAWKPEQVINAFDQTAPPGEFSGAKNMPPIGPRTEDGKFLPRTDFGRALQEKGFEIKPFGAVGGRSIEIFDANKNLVAEITSKEVAPGEANITNVKVQRPLRGQGVGEALYRELGALLQADGITKVTGDVVAPEPLGLRQKVFGDFEDLRVGGEPASVADAITAANMTKKGVQFSHIEPTNRITAESRFQPRSIKEPAVQDGVDGFLTEDGEFLTPKAAFDRALETKQISSDDYVARRTDYERDAEQSGISLAPEGELDPVIFQDVRRDQGDAARFLPAEELVAPEPTETGPDLRIVPAAAGGGKRPPSGPELRPPPVAAGVAAKEEESAGFLPEPDEEIKSVAAKYAETAGIPYSPKGGYAEVKPDLARRLADFYEAAKSNPNDPEVKASYAALIKETEEQGKSILAAGYKIEPWTGEGEPYKNSAAAIADVRDNKHLFFRKTSDAFGTGKEAAGNPMTSESGVVPGQSVNDVFRWVHDFFGHAKEGYQFGPRGEFNAWRTHSEMYSPEAQGALAAETLAQNSWVNFGKHLEGKNVPQSSRPFAEQKNIVIPKDLIDEAGFQPRTDAGKKLEERGFRVVPSGEVSARRVGIQNAAGEEIAFIESVRRSPKSAEIAFVYKKSDAPAGLGEVLYREVGSQLKEDGVKELTGTVISPEPLAIRNKIFEGDFKSLEVNFEPSTYPEAIATAERLQRRSRGEGDESEFPEDVASIEPVNEITEGTMFQPKVARDAQGRPLKKNGDVDYKRWQAEGVARRKALLDSAGENYEPTEPTPPIVGTKKKTGKTITAYHFSAVGDALSEVDPSFMRPSVDPYWGNDINKSFFYVDSVPKGYKFANRYGYKSEIDLGQLYDATGKDPMGYLSKQNRLEADEAVRSAGYSGILVPIKGGKRVAVMYDSVPAKFIGRTDDSGNLIKGSGGFLPTGDYWLDSDGKFIKAPEGHLKRAEELIGNGVDEVTYSDMYNKGYVRVISADREFHALNSERPKISDLNSKQRAALEDEILQLGQGLVFNGRPVGGAAGFLPSGDSLPGFEDRTVEELGRAKAARRIASVKRNNPEAVIPQYARDEEGRVIVKPDGDPKTVTLDYDFINSPVAKEAAKGLKGTARESAAASAVGDKLAELYKSVEKDPDIKAGAKWYSTARTRLKKVFGDDSKFFAELLGATSARTPVDTNYRFALDAYNQFKEGKFDDVLAKYREGKQRWEEQDLGDFKGETRGQFMDYWVDKNDLTVRQSNGKKFGMNGRAVLRVLDGSWASEVQGPKTPNFAGNLTGETFEATIDVWAARTLARLANEGGKNRWRILPENETGVTDADFYFGQAAYRAAAEKLGLKPDALQAVLWFAEKHHWEQNGWTRGAGAEKSDFNVLLAETERGPSGTFRMKTPQIDLDFESNLGTLKKRDKKK